MRGRILSSGLRDVRNLANQACGPTILHRPPFDLKKTTFEFSYVTKPKPDGGFIGRPNDPSMETLEGATEEEVQQKILAAITVALGQKSLLSIRSLLPTNVKVNSQQTVIFKDNAGTTVDLIPQASLERTSSSSEAPTPIQFERSSVPWLAIVLVVATAVLLYAILR